MKKVLLVLLVAFCLTTFGVFAAEINFSGEFEFGGMANSDEYAGEFDKIELDIEAVIDDYNTFSMELEDDTANNDPGDVPLNLSWATVTTDWGTLLSLPVGLNTVVGYDGMGIGDDIGATGWGLESYGGTWLDTEAAGQLNITLADMVTVSGSANFDTDPAGADELEAVLGASIVGIEPLILNVAYNTTGEDSINAEAQYSLELGEGMGLDVAGSMNYDLDEDVAEGSELFYGLGAGFSVADATIGVSFNGNDADALNNMGVDLNYGLTDALCVDVATIFDLTEDAEDTFLGLDVSAGYDAGAVSYRLGYLYSDGYGTDAYYGCETACADGGIYMAVELDF